MPHTLSTPWIACAMAAQQLGQPPVAQQQRLAQQRVHAAGVQPRDGSAGAELQQAPRHSDPELRSERAAHRGLQRPQQGSAKRSVHGPVQDRE